MRIVSLLPSATEIICSLGLREQLVGVTHECDYPASVLGLPKVTSTLIPHGLDSKGIDRLVRERLDSTTALYSLRMDILAELKPDLIVTQALCDVCAVAESEVVEAINYLPGNTQLVNLEPMTLEDVFETIKLVGEASGQSRLSLRLVEELKSRVESVSQRSQALLADKECPTVAFLEWLDPLFNGGHWNPELIELAGGIDCFANKHKPSSSISWSRLKECNPDYIFIACCGFDLERSLQDVGLLRRNQEWQGLGAVQDNRVFLTDGNAYFSRSGPRLVDSLEIIAHALHPNLHPPPEFAPPALRL